MTAKVTQVKAGLGAKDRGEFRVRKFNLFEEADADEYARLRTDAANAAKGITVEQIREYTRKTVIRDSDPDGHDSVTTVEEIFLVVQYWEKKRRTKQEDADDDSKGQRKMSSIP